MSLGDDVPAGSTKRKFVLSAEMIAAIGDCVHFGEFSNEAEIMERVAELPSAIDRYKEAVRPSERGVQEML